MHWSRKSRHVARKGTHLVIVHNRPVVEAKAPQARIHVNNLTTSKPRHTALLLPLELFCVAIKVRVLVVKTPLLTRPTADV
jgi:hypothetical protein